ncbi:hypothetical protein IPG41_04530 [Candidatus Peregrinibacteria bacterium]|nr:MAG: hypothetical protein IPG41_04530 [Candidatus Peregrinibacteria bacterium]
MPLTVNNRELLRNYKTLKGKLLRGEVSEIAVKQGKGKIITLKVKKTTQSAFEHTLELIEKHSFSHLKRPEADLFDYL